MASTSRTDTLSVSRGSFLPSRVERRPAPDRQADLRYCARPVLYHQPGRQAIIDRKKQEIEEREAAVAEEKKRLGLE